MWHTIDTTHYFLIKKHAFYIPPPPRKEEWEAVDRIVLLIPRNMNAACEKNEPKETLSWSKIKIKSSLLFFQSHVPPEVISTQVLSNQMNPWHASAYATDDWLPHSQQNCWFTNCHLSPRHLCAVWGWREGLSWETISSFTMSSSHFGFNLHYRLKGWTTFSMD